MDPMAARLRFARRPYPLIDLAAIVPFWLGALLPIDLRILRVLRVFRILKLTRYSPTMHVLFRAIWNERRTLIGTLLLVMTLLLFVSTLAYYAERDVQPDKFGTIPDAMWWAMATLTTVGYGDVTPITPIGKLLGGAAMICGIIVLALPIAIIASGFAAEVGRRDFVVTWSLVSRIPVLAELEIDELNHVMPFLNAQFCEAHRDIISPDDRADAMYFVVAGGVRMRTEAGESLFSAGDFFGELAMLEGRDHTHNYRTLGPTKLLRLNHDDYQHLAESHPVVTDKIVAMAKMRRAARDSGKVDPTHARG
jgi:voltage-gated potassium channel